MTTLAVTASLLATAGNPISANPIEIDLDDLRESGVAIPEGWTPGSAAAPSARPDVLGFEPNVGQTDEAVDYLGRGRGITYFLVDGDLVLDLPGQDPDDGGEAIRLDWRGAEDVDAVSGAEVGHDINYLFGSDPTAWRTGVRATDSVTYADVFPGIDIRYLGEKQTLRYDVLIDAGADPSAIELAIEGAAGVSIDAQGRLVIATERGRTLRFDAPETYQDIDGERISVDSSYTISDGIVGFELGDYDLAYALVIDPDLEYASYVGGTNDDDGQDLALADDGSVYVVGTSFTSGYPTTVGSYQQTNAGAEDGYVTKLSADGTTILWATYIGGTNNDYADHVDVDGNEPVVAGTTFSTNFPTTAGAHSTSRSGSRDIFVSRLTEDGTALTFSTYLGGSGTNDFIDDIELDAAGNVLLGGFTDSTDFPTSVGAYDTSSDGSAGWVGELSADGSTVTMATYLEGSTSTQDRVYGVERLGDGRIAVAGVASSTDFPTSAGAYDSTNNGGDDALLAIFDSGLTSLEYSTYLGGLSTDRSTAIGERGDGTIVISGRAGTGLPTTAGAFDTTHNGSNDMFLAAFDTDQTGTDQLVWLTYVGGSGSDLAFRLEVAPDDSILATGVTASTGLATAGAYDTTHNGGNDPFLAQVSSDGSSLDYFSYLGGTAAETGRAIEWDLSTGHIWIAGTTQSTDMATTPDAYSTTNAGSGDAYVVRFQHAFVVNSTADVVDQNLGDGLCDTGNLVGADPECTLRAAIQEINASSVLHTIVVPAGTYTLTIAGTGEDLAATGDLDIDTTISIVGAGSAMTLIDGNALGPRFPCQLGRKRCATGSHGDRWFGERCGWRCSHRQSFGLEHHHALGHRQQQRPWFWRWRPAGPRDLDRHRLAHHRQHLPGRGRWDVHQRRCDRRREHDRHELGYDCRRRRHLLGKCQRIADHDELHCVREQRKQWRGHQGRPARHAHERHRDCELGNE